MKYLKSIIMRIILIGIIIFTNGPLFIGCSTHYNVLRPIPKDIKPIVVSVAIVQENTALFKKGSFDLPAEVLFSTDPNMSNAKLKDLAHEIFKLKGTKQKDKVALVEIY